MPYEIEVQRNGHLYTVSVPELSVPKCESCGELVFDYEADDQIEKALEDKIRHAAPSLNGDTNLTLPSRAITVYHAAYYAYELTRRGASNNQLSPFVSPDGQDSHRHTGIGNTIEIDELHTHMLWYVTEHELAGLAAFDRPTRSFELFPLGKSWPQVPAGQYHLGNDEHDGEYPYCLSHPLAQEVIKRAKERKLRPTYLRFDYSSHPDKTPAMDELVGQSGWLQLYQLTVESEDTLFFAAINDQNKPVDPELCAGLMLVGAEAAPVEFDPSYLSLVGQMAELEEQTSQQIAERNKSNSQPNQVAVGHRPKADRKIKELFTARWEVV